MMVRGQVKPITIDWFMIEELDKYTVTGKSDLSLKELSIPDPSIWIATVRDLVNITFKFEIIK